MATTQKIVDAGGTTTSFSNTPQAQDDILNYTEDSVVKGSLSTSIILDVMQNDLGGNAKTLFSIDDGSSASTTTKQPAPIDLASADYLTSGISAWEDIGNGISIRINNGKVEMNLAGYLSANGLSSLQALGAGVQISDSFTYAIKLGNGTLSWATATFNIVGTNDGPIITGSSGLGSVTEDTLPTSAAGTINFSDIDVTDAHTVSATPAAGGYLGTFTSIVTNDSTGDGTGQVSWSFAADNAALQFLAAGQILTQTYNVTINDGHGGTVSQAVTVTITGTNDSPDIRVNAGDSGGETIAEANSGLSATGTLTVTDVDTLDTVSSAVTGVALSGTAGSLVAADVLSMLSLSTTSALTANTGEAHNLGWTFNSGSQAFNYLAAGEHLTLTYTVTSTDNHSTSDTQTVTVTITGTNDKPVAVADTNSGNEDTTITGSVATNDSDIDDGATLTYALDAPVAGLTINNDGSYSFDAANAAYQHLAEGATTDVVANYTVTDEHGATATSTLTITLTGTNDKPVAVADTNSGNEDTTITGSVATNDSDVDDGATLTYALDAPVAGLTLGTNGSYSFDAANAAYQHLAEGATTDVVANYTVTDEHGATATSTLTITLTGTNDKPVAVADIDAGLEDSTITGSVAANDSDVDDGATLTYALDVPVAGLTLGTNGSYSFDAANAAYQHLAEGATTDVVANYTVTDEHGATATSTLTITLTGTNDKPVAVADIDAGLEDSTITGSVATNDSDVDDGATLTYALDAPVAGLTLGTNGSYSFDAANAAYQHLAEGATTDVVANYTVTDEHGATATSTLTITLTGTNDKPVAVADTNSGLEDSTITGSVAANDSDVDDGATLTYALDVPVAGLTLGTNGSYSFDAANAAYQHLAEGATTDVVANYTVTDEHGATATSTLTITLTGTNDKPVAVADTNSGLEDSTITGSVATNDSDVDDGATLTYALNAPVAGLTLGTNGSYSFDAANAAYQHLAEGATTDVVANYTVTDEHGATATSTLTITLTGTNDKPVAVADIDAGLEDSTITGSVATNDSDVDDGATLTYALDAPVAGLTLGTNGSYSFDAANAAYQHLAAGATTDVVANYTVTDEHGATATSTLTITLTGTNDKPVAVADIDAGLEDSTITGSVAANDSDVDDGATLTYALDAPVAGLTLGTNGSYSFDASDAAYQHLAAGATTDVVANYTVTDEHGATDDATLTITVTGVNDGPTATINTFAATEGAIQTATSGTPLAAGNVITGGTPDSDPDGDSLTVTSITAPTVTETDAQLSITSITSQSAGSGEIARYQILTNTGTALLAVTSGGDVRLWTTAGDPFQGLGSGESAAINFNYTVSDGHGGTSSAATTITVNGSNDGPTATINTFAATEDAIQTATSGTPLAAGNVITGGTPDSDPDGDSLTVTSITAPTVTETDAQLSITSITSQSAGSGEIARYQILTNTGTALLAVTSGGDVRLWTTAGDPFQGLGSGESAAINFNYTVSDGHGGTSSAATTITVNGSNDGPTATINTFAATEGAIQTATSGTPLAAGNVITGGTPDSDPDGDSLTVTSITAPTVTETDAQLSITSITSQSAGSGEVARYQILTNTGTALLAVTSGGDVRLWTTAGDPFQGLGSGESAAINFNYTVSDGHGGTSSAATTITVNGSEDISNTLISTVVDGRQGNNSTPSTVTITFATAAHANFVNLSDVMHVSGLANVTVINGSGSFIDSTHYQFSVDKGAGSSNGSSYTLDIDAGAFSDNAGNTNAAKHTTNLKPAGVSGEAINLALGDLALSDHNQIHVTVGGVPAGWSLNAGTLNADGTWTLDTADPGALAVTSPGDFTGAIVLDVNATWTNADGTTGSASISDNIEVFAPGNPIYALSQEDHLTGSSGADLFVFGQPIAHDTLHSFDAAADRIDLIGFVGVNGFGDLVIADDANGNAVVTISSGETITVLGVAAAQLGAGNFVFNEEPVTQNAGTMSIADGAIMPLGGIVENTGTIALNGAGGATQLEVIVNSLTLKGGGQVTLSDSDGNLIFGGAPEAVLNNVDNTISGAGQIGGGQLTLVNAGTINANGSHALVIDTGSIAVTNSGVIEASGSGGLIILSDVDNTGSIRANGGDVAIHGDVTGSGTATISGAGTLELDGASNVDVEFADSAAQRLILDEGNDFAGTVTGFGDGDSFDFSTIGVGGSATFSYTEDASGLGGLLTASDGIDSISIQLFGDYAAGDFVGLQDQHHGFVVTYHPFAVI